MEILKLAFVGLTAGLFSSFVANRDYRYKKWWELRVIAYQDLIEALSDLVYYFDRHYKAETEHWTLKEDDLEKLSHHWEAAFPKVKKSGESGAFLLSDDVNHSLEKLIECNNRHYDSYFEFLENNLIEARNCLSLVVFSSKKDLKIGGKWL